MNFNLIVKGGGGDFSFSALPLSLMAPPKMPARMGPMTGDTSMEATRTTLEFSIRPKKAMMPERISSSRKSKENSAPSLILAITSDTNNL